MPLLIGVDEAGYGPNLGPLVISATAWRVAEGIGVNDLYERLASAISPPPLPAGDPRVAMGDSKQLYQPKRGLAQLELGVLSALGICNQPESATSIPRTWREVWERLDPLAWPQMRDLPWYQNFDTPLPFRVPQQQLDAGRELLKRHMSKLPVQLETIRSRVVFPRQFNQGVDQLGNKSTLLSRVSLKLVAELLDQLPAEQVEVLCDKHGGRNRYAHLIHHALGDALVQVRYEGRQESAYSVKRAARKIAFRFRAKGDHYLPAALASMTSKYLRELAMRAFNTFWCEQMPELHPTAGYPVDAKRFRQQTVPIQQRLKIGAELFWRNR